MSVLDELLADLLSERSTFDGGGTDWDAVEVNDVERIMREFEAAHPGLVDHWAVCPDCGYAESRKWRGNPDRWMDGLEGGCPTCVKEATE
jgi:hypothetical protein